LDLSIIDKNIKGDNMAKSADKYHIFTHRIQCEDCGRYINNRKADMTHTCSK